MQVVGVLPDTRDHSLDGAPARRACFSYDRSDTTIGYPTSLRFEVRTDGDPAALVKPMRAAAIAVDPSLPINGVAPLTSAMRQSIREERLVARLASAFGVLALRLAGIGLFGVMSYAIARRTGELGLRGALGARAGDVIRLVVTDALRLVGAEIIVGLPLALACARLLSTQVHGVGPIDLVSIGAALIVLALSAVLAVLIPAVRASRVSPVVALRAD